MAVRGSTATWKPLHQLTYPRWEIVLNIAFHFMTIVVAVIELHQLPEMHQRSFLSFLIQNWQRYGIMCVMASGLVVAFLVCSWGFRFLSPHNLVVQHTVCVLLELVVIWQLFSKDVLLLLLSYSLLWGLLLIICRHPAPLWILAVVSFLYMFFKDLDFSITSGAIFAYFQCRAIIIGTDLLQLWQAPSGEWKLEWICGAVRYLFYPCTLLSGSMIGLRQFLHQTSHPKILLTPRRLTGRLCRLLLSGLLYVILQWVHSTCVSALRQQNRDAIFTTFSVSLVLAQFHLFHSLLYGLPHIVGIVDGIQWPGQPVCVFGVLNWAELWRNFDKGLFFFMHQYIYRPLGGNRVSALRTLFNTACCFAFVWLFHGPYYEINCWIVANFIFLHLEGLADQLIRQGGGTTLASCMDRFLSESMQRRIRIVLQSQVLLLGSIYSIQFMAVVEFPQKLLNRPDIFSVYGYLSLWFYTMGQLTLYWRQCSWYAACTQIEPSSSHRLQFDHSHGHKI